MHLGYSVLLAVGTSAAVDFLIYKLKHLFPVLWGVALGEELLGHVIMLCLRWGNLPEWSELAVITTPLYYR